MRKIMNFFCKVVFIMVLFVAVFPAMEARSAEVYGDLIRKNMSKATDSDAEDNKDNVGDIIVEIETSAEEEELERGRGEAISRFDILSISGVMEDGKSQLERISNATGSTEYRAKNTYKREGLYMDIARRGTIGTIRTNTPDCEINQVGAPYNCTYDSFGGLIEWSTHNEIKITNPDISELHIQYVVTSSYNNGNTRTFRRDVYIPLVDERTEAPQTPQIIANPTNYL